jgi:hypothetical protein
MNNERLDPRTRKDLSDIGATGEWRCLRNKKTSTVMKRMY